MFPNVICPFSLVSHAAPIHKHVTSLPNDIQAHPYLLRLEIFSYLYYLYPMFLRNYKVKLKKAISVAYHLYFSNRTQMLFTLTHPPLIWLRTFSGYRSSLGI